MYDMNFDMEHDVHAYIPLSLYHTLTTDMIETTTTL